MVNPLQQRRDDASLAKKKSRNSEAMIAGLICVYMFLTLGIAPAGYVLLGLLASALTAFLLCRSIHLEKLLLYVIGIFLAYVSMIGFFLNLLQQELSLINLVWGLLSICVILCVLLRQGKFKRPEIVFDLRRFATIACIFAVSFFFYLYPSLPSMTSPCTPGFDCSHHIEYSAGIYDKKELVPPVDVWAYYPFGLHLNVALLSEVFTSAVPSPTNFFYPFMALMTALSLSAACCILMDHKAGKAYVLLLAALLMLSVFPASALIGYGFWAQVYGTFYIILFFLALGDYRHRTERNIIYLLALLCVAAYLGYQVLVAMPVILGFALALLFTPEISRKARVYHFVLFFSVFAMVFCLSTYDNYRKYLTSEKDIFSDTPTGYASIVMSYEQRHSINMESFQAFQLTYRRLLEQQGIILFFDAGRYGFLFIFLAMLALLRTGKYDAAFIYFVSIIAEMAFFAWGLQERFVSLYYFSKISYIMIYPLLLYSVLGMGKVVDCWGIAEKPLKWRKIAAGLVSLSVVLVLAYATQLHAWSDKIFGIDKQLFGDREKLISTNYKDYTGWPLMSFNRIDYFYALTQARLPYNYTFSDWASGKKM